MVVVAKTKGVPDEGDKMQKQKVGICVDLTKLNTRSYLERNTICPQSTDNGKSVHEARCQLRVLANTSLA